MFVPLVPPNSNKQEPDLGLSHQPEFVHVDVMACVVLWTAALFLLGFGAWLRLNGKANQIIEQMTPKPQTCLCCEKEFAPKRIPFVFGPPELLEPPPPGLYMCTGTVAAQALVSALTATASI